jgi:predicted nucleic acid-binding protein
MSESTIVIDTNTLISLLLAPSSVPAQAVKLAFEIGVVITSLETLQELTEVLNRDKFDRYNRQLLSPDSGRINFFSSRVIVSPLARVS